MYIYFLVYISQIRMKKMEGDDKNGKYSILMVPWLGHGHVSPFFELAKSLIGKDFYIFFCSTAINLNSLKPKLTQKHLSSSMELVELKLPTSPGLPPHRHTTAGLPSRLMVSLKRAFDSAASAFDTLLRELNPDLVVYDFLQPWAPKVALSAHIPALMFQPTGALTAAMVAYKLKHPNSSDISLIFDEIRLSEYDIKHVNNFFKSSVNDESDKLKIEECIERSCNMILVKSFREIEGKYIDFLSTLIQKKVIPVGPLVQELEDDVVSTRAFEKWLNKKEKSCSILVSFGSEFYLSKKDIEEIAYGLELSNVDFIWVIRFPITDGKERKKSLEEQLPIEFIERVGDRGMVVEGWVPQAWILSHPSMGGFLSHCGWSSVIESIKFGVPIIAAPMHLDQPLNARLVEQLDVGVVVERDDRGLCREEVSKSIKKVVVEKNGDKMRKKVKELADIIKKKDNEEVDAVADELRKLCKRKKEEEDFRSNSCKTTMKIDDAISTNMGPFCKYNN